MLSLAIFWRVGNESEAKLILVTVMQALKTLIWLRWPFLDALGPQCSTSQLLLACRCFWWPWILNKHLM